MDWLVDIDRAIADGVLSNAAGAELKRRAREAMVAHAINLALFCGVVMVIGGTAAWLEDRHALTGLGGFVALAGTAALLGAGERVRLVANATALIGATLAAGALAAILFEAPADRLLAGALLGLPLAAAGLAMRRLAPERLAVLGGWLVFLGGSVHVAGVLSAESALRLDWLALHHAGAVAIVCGLALDVRAVTALAILPLAAALSSETFYSHAVYSVAIYEATLTILQMAAVALVALWASLRFAERIARHARLIGQLALIWANMAFWVGSLWGDVVGFHLWGPRWDEVVGPEAPRTAESWKTWRAAVEAFEAASLAVGADAFTILWAAGLLAVGAWAAATARRAVLNIAVTFGAIHFYTQYFERLEATPGAFVAAGVIAILAAWGLWSVNRRMLAGRGPAA